MAALAKVEVLAYVALVPPPDDRMLEVRFFFRNDKDVKTRTKLEIEKQSRIHLIS